MFRRSKKSGFTLIELMVVVAIIGILAAIAIPSYMNFVTKTKRSEVKANLSAIHSAEISYYSEYDLFSNSFITIRWVPVGSNKYYSYTVGSEIYGLGDPVPGSISGLPGAGTESFSAYGWGNIDKDIAVLDIWKINESKYIEMISDDINN